MGDHSIWVWIIFHVFVLAMLALDLGVFHRKHQVVRVRAALGWPCPCCFCFPLKGFSSDTC